MICWGQLTTFENTVRGYNLRKLIPLIFILLVAAACRGEKQPATTAVPTQPVTQPTTTVAQQPAAVQSKTIAAPANTPTIPAATPIPTDVPPMPLPTPMTPLVENYTVRAGDTLGGISYAYDISLEELLTLNGLDENAIIHVGQSLRVPLDVNRTAPVVRLMPDSEAVFSPAYVGFDVETYVREQNGFLAGYSERVNGIPLSGAEIIEHLARQFSVGPRVMLALLEYYSGWVTQPQPTAARPLGIGNPYADSLYRQMSWMAAMVNQGYYNYKRSGITTVKFYRGGRALVPAGMNAGTVGILNALAVNSDWETWQTEIGADGFIKTYKKLFGDPYAREISPIVPVTLTQPLMELPWQAGDTFYYTGGPHEGYGTGSALAAIDFGPPDVLGSCYYSDVPLTAVAAGRIFLGSKGETYLDLDADGNLQTGWVVLYLHMVADDSLTQGQLVEAGDVLGYASCEGGMADASHLHIARRYNGEWIPADGRVPFVLSGWRVQAGNAPYNGTMVRGDEIKTACECWDESNALVAGQ